MRKIANNSWFCWIIGRLFVRKFLSHVQDYPPEYYGDCLCISCGVCRWHMAALTSLPEARIAQ